VLRSVKSLLNADQNKLELFDKEKN